MVLHSKGGQGFKEHIERTEPFNLFSRSHIARLEIEVNRANPPNYGFFTDQKEN